MLRNLAALGSGILFGVGLAASQMVDPAKILAFLDVAGAWDPSLLVVMMGAVAISLASFRYILRRPAPVLASRFTLPTAREVDGRLVTGAAVYGVGWGMVGFCVGPAIASFAFLQPKSFIFVAAMLAGALISKGTGKRPATAEPAAT
ncbi:MAG: DUF6691 family protein [Alphaproteobacteria bacterium]